MFVSHNDYLIQKDHFDHLLREAERERLIQAAGLGSGGAHRKMAGWVGAQMVKWGAALQRYSAVSPPQPTSRKLHTGY